MRQKKTGLLCALIIFSIFVIPFSSSTSPQSQSLTSNNCEHTHTKEHLAWLEDSPIGKRIWTYGKVLQLVEEIYYEELSEQEKRDLIMKIEKSLSSVFFELDSHTMYYSPEYLAKARVASNSYNPEHVGIGLYLENPDKLEREKLYRQFIREAFPGITKEDFEKRTHLVTEIEKWLASNNVWFKILLGRMNNKEIPRAGLLITGVESGSAAQKSVLIQKIGWHIVGVDELPIEGLSWSEAIRKIRGSVGSTVTLTIVDQKTRKREHVVVTRIECNSSNIFGSKLTSSIGYIQVKDFNFVGPPQVFPVEAFHKALESLHNQDMEKLVLDLRNNPGGSIFIALEILDALLPPDLKLAYTKSRGQVLVDYYSDQPQVFKGEIVVLLNEYSASAAELVALSLRDHDRATIVGTKSYGKGSGQTSITLPDGAFLMLTSFQYYSPITERCIHGEGIIPDKFVEDDLSTITDEVLETAIKILEK